MHLRKLYSGALLASFCLGVGAASHAASPELRPLEGDSVIHDFRFASGETLPELRLHYTYLGKPKKDALGRVTNAVHAAGGKIVTQRWHVGRVSHTALQPNGGAPVAP